MDMIERYGLSNIVNARGPYTPLGVSRSPAAVAEAAGEALRHYFVLEELQTAADRELARYAGAEAGTVTHCVAAAITLSVTAAMTGGAPCAVARLPDTEGMADRAVLPAGHAVDYGHPITQAIRLSGAVPVLAGTDRACNADDLERAIDPDRTCCVLLVSSRLTRGAPIDLADAVAVAHRHGLPAFIDGAAQDLQLAALLETGADLVLISGQKYLASPTAGLVIGRRKWVDAVRAQEKGIGRPMKATKESLAGVLAAIEVRSDTDTASWCAAQAERMAAFVQSLGHLDGVMGFVLPDPGGAPIGRVHLRIDPLRARYDAASLEAALRTGTPPIHVMPHRLDKNEIVLEIVQLSDAEIGTIAARLEALMSRAGAR